jgi:hypothetical protein
VKAVRFAAVASGFCRQSGPPLLVHTRRGLVEKPCGGIAGLPSKRGRRSLDPPFDSLRQSADAIAPVGAPLGSGQEFLARCIAAYPTVHPLVEQFRAVGVSRPVDLTDPADRAFALGVIEGWAAQVGEDELPPGISELADALREQDWEV